MTAWLFETFIPGLPVSKGSLTAFTAGGRTIMVEKRSAPARKRLENWRAVLNLSLTSGWRVPPHGEVRGRYKAPLRVEMIFRLPRPKSLPRYATQPTTYPDLDKLARVVMDELTGIVAKDDAQIVDLHAIKEYADEAAGRPAGVIVRIGLGEAGGA